MFGFVSYPSSVRLIFIWLYALPLSVEVIVVWLSVLSLLCEVIVVVPCLFVDIVLLERVVVYS